jgi:serine beta-lactamase-like protein LACTB
MLHIDFPFFFSSGIRHYTKKGEVEPDNELLLAEYYLSRSFATVNEALSIFLNDELLHHPGTTWHYTTHGYTLLSAILERAAGEKQNFTELLKDLVIQQLGLRHTKLEYPHEIVPNRSRYYCRRAVTENIRNVAYVDLSYKWAGGGMISNVNDLLVFGNTLLQCRQTKPGSALSNNQILKAETIRELWTPVTATNKKGTFYGLGWQIATEKPSSVNESTIPAHIYHTGGAVGATSVLLLIPCSNNCSNPRCGICIVILTNFENASEIYQTALDIALIFRQISPCTSSL